jgi:hypothetical protein
LAEIDAAATVQYRKKLRRQPYVKAKPGAKGSTLADGEAAREFKRRPNKANKLRV